MPHNNSPLPSSFDSDPDFYLESRWQKITRRLKEEPLIPLGLALTCMALYGATRSMKAGDHERTNRMFRARIYAQGFTLLVTVAGSIYWKSDRQKRKEFDALIHEKNAHSKRDAWIKELEAREEEQKMLKARHERAVFDKKKIHAQEVKDIEIEVTNTMEKTEKRPGVVETVRDTLGSGFGGKKS